MGRVLLQPQPAVAAHRLGDVDEQRVRHGVAAEGQQRVDHLLGVVARGARVPQAQRRQPVGVDVLGGALELGEGRDRLAGIARARVVDLQQQRLVALDDQGSVVHRGPSGASARADRVGCVHERSSLLSGAVGRNVGPRGTPLRAVAPRLVGGGVDEDVVALDRLAQAEAGGAEVADEVGQAHQRLADQQLGDRRGAVGDVHVQVVGVVVADHRRHRVLDQQVVEGGDDGAHVAAVGGLEDRPQRGLEAPQGGHVALGHGGVQPRALGEVVQQRVDVGQLGVEQRRRRLGIPDEVHLTTLRLGRGQRSHRRDAVYGEQPLVVAAVVVRHQLATLEPQGSTTRSELAPWLST